MMHSLWHLLLTSGAALGITITVDSFEAGNPASNAIDGNINTFWHTEYSPVLVPLPHWAILDLGQSELLNGFSYLPRQDGNSNGNIGLHTIELSLDNTTWTLVANATFIDDMSSKQTGFPNAMARYIRITAYTEAGNRGPWSSAAEFGVLTAPTSTTLGQWSPMIAIPLVPAAAFVMHNTGKILTFSAYSVNSYGAGVSGNTITAIYDPVTGIISEADITNTNHDMFCPGMSLDSNGRAIVTGGDTANQTSIYDPVSNTVSEHRVSKFFVPLLPNCSASSCAPLLHFFLKSSLNGRILTS
jgi:galactose oxidase